MIQIDDRVQQCNTVGTVAESIHIRYGRYRTRDCVAICTALTVLYKWGPICITVGSVASCTAWHSSAQQLMVLLMQGDTSMVTIVVVVVVVVMSGGGFLTSIIDCDDNQPGGFPTSSWWVVCQAVHHDSNHLHLLQCFALKIGNSTIGNNEIVSTPSVSHKMIL